MLSQLSTELRFPQIDQINDVVYHQVRSLREVRQLKLSLLIPRTDQAKPAIVYFPGGGFTSAIYHKFIQMRLALAQQGFVVAAVEYRVIPDTYPAPLEDAMTAIAYLRQYARDYQINPDFIGVLGDSAGGWLAQMMALAQMDLKDSLCLPKETSGVSSQIQAAVSLYGISNLLNIGEGFEAKIQQVHQSPAVTEALLLHGVAFDQFAGMAINQDPQKALQASPMGHLSGDKPPLLLMHGLKDQLVSPTQSLQLYQALKQKKQPVEYVQLPQAGHGDLYWYQPAIIDYVCQWFKRHLASPETSLPTQQNIHNDL